MFVSMAIFARADSPEAVEAALRDAHAQLEIVIEPIVDREDDGTTPSERSAEAV